MFLKWWKGMSIYVQSILYSSNPKLLLFYGWFIVVDCIFRLKDNMQTALTQCPSNWNSWCKRKYITFKWIRNLFLEHECIKIFRFLSNLLCYYINVSKWEYPSNSISVLQHITLDILFQKSFHRAKTAWIESNAQPHNPCTCCGHISTRISVYIFYIFRR